jgi:hypothetical protein
MIRIFLWPRIVLYSLSVTRNFVVSPHEPLLKLGMRWVQILWNTGLRGPQSRHPSPLPSPDDGNRSSFQNAVSLFRK